MILSLFSVHDLLPASFLASKLQDRPTLILVLGSHVAITNPIQHGGPHSQLAKIYRSCSHRSLD